MSKHSGRIRALPVPIVPPASDTADLRQTISQVDEFLATLSHELRQPLAAALAAIEIQKHNPRVDRQERARRVIEQQVRYIARLVGDLSEVSQISRGTLYLHRERLDLRAVVNDPIVMTESMFEERRHRVACSLGTEPAWVTG